MSKHTWTPAKIKISAPFTPDYLSWVTSKVLCLLDEKPYLCFKRTAKTTTVTWTHFYCNSSIESKKVLININTMPMFKSPFGNPPTPPSLHEERKEKKFKTKKLVAPAVAPIITWKKATSFPYLQDFHCWQGVFCIRDVRRWKNNAHTKDTHLHGTCFF